MSRTVVLQSYRKTSARWLVTCRDSVKSWAASQKFGYESLGDADFFGYLSPELFTMLRSVSSATAADAARLLWAREVLNSGVVDRTIWIDDDVLLLRDGPFFNNDCEVVLSREQWLSRHSNGTLTRKAAVNNCLMALQRGSRFLEFYIWSIEHIVLKGKINKTSLGPDFLTSIARHVPFDVIASVPTISPLILSELALGKTNLVNHICPGGLDGVSGAHLCGSLVGRCFGEIEITDELIECVTQSLLQLTNKR